MAGKIGRRAGRRTSTRSDGHPPAPHGRDDWPVCADRIRKEHGVDPRKLRPSELCRLLNSTPLGEVIDDRKLRRQRNAAGVRVASKTDASRIDLLRYTAWLRAERRARAQAAGDGLGGYDAVRERALARSKALSLSGRNIGELPKVSSRRRKNRARTDFCYFCSKYFPLTFDKPWSADHLKVIALIERCVLTGGLFAMAMPRGSGKSSLCEIACIWAALYGHRQFVVVIGATESHAADMLDSIKSELEHNDLLLEDFPEVCFPIRALEGIYQRANGQLFEGVATGIGWSAEEVVLPSIPGSPASGVIIRVAGLTGQLRGMKYKRADGRAVRPSLVLVDDPQTDESARSPSQCATRERVLSGAVLGLAGPGVKIAGLMTLTVVRPDDMADRILNRTRHPQWQGERTKMLYDFPADEKLWGEYAEVLKHGLAAGEGVTPATRFYRRHRLAMDRGARVAWRHRFNPDELSAVQNAMNIKILDEASFWAEYQNEPMPEEVLGSPTLSAAEIAAKTNGMERGHLPEGCDHLVAFIDVQEAVLFYAVVGWGSDFTGWLVDYGTEPDQAEPYFTLRNAKRTLQQRHKGKNPGLEAVLYEGLTTLTDRLCSREWRRDDGGRLRIERCLIDANWGDSKDTVYLYCRQSPHAALLLPSHGRYFGASSVPMSDYRKQRGDRVGLNWRMPNVRGKRAVRHVVFDANFWKSFVHQRLAVAMGDPGCLSLFGRDPKTHRLLADHLTAEVPIKTEARGRIVDEWKMARPGLDNHWFDCVVGAAVAGAMQGASLFGAGDGGQRRQKRRVKLSDLQRRS